jgi:tetratricopeptide (TPR) repeat protein
VQASPDWWIKIGDLGISKRVNQDTALRTRVGSPGYFAPEIVQQELYGSDTTSVEYTHAVDIWALGVMTHYMLTKLLPFRQLHDLLAYARGGEFPTSSLSEHRIGSEGQNLIQLLMATTPEDRLTVQLASQNAWVRHHLHSGNVEREQTPGETYMLKNSNATNAKPHDPIGAAQSSTSQQIALMGSSSDTSRSWFGSNEWTTQVVATRTLRDMLHSDMGLERSRKPQDIVTFNSTELIRSSSELNEPRSLSQGEEPHGPQDAEKTLEHDTSTEDGGGTASSTGIMSGDTQHVLGIRYFQKGYYEKAELMFSEAYHLRRGRLGLDHKDALSSLYMQAKALLGPRNRRAVGNLIEQHCIAEKDTRGRLGPFTVAVCDELGGLFFAAGAYHEAGMMASLMYEDSARYNNPPPGQGSREHEFCIWKNAMCLFKQGQIPLARIYFTALKHRLEPGPTDIATKKFPFEGGSLRFGCKALFLDALCAFQDCQYVYPEDAFRNIHDYQCKVSGRFHHETLAALHMLGCAYHMQQKYKKAHAVFNEVYTARLETLGEDHKDTTFSAECLAISSQAQHSRLKRHFLNTHVPPIPVVDPTLEWERVPGSRADELVGVL